MTTTNYLWDPLTDSVVHETDGSNVTQATYTSEPAEFGPLVSQRRGGITSYHHFDALGSTRQLTNAAGTVTDSYTPSAWGEEVVATGSSINPHRWLGRSGYSYSSTLAMFQVRRRSFLPTTGRWMTVDPIGFDAGDLNLFRYVSNAPVLISDGSGLKGRWPKWCYANALTIIYCYFKFGSDVVPDPPPGGANPPGKPAAPPRALKDWGCVGAGGGVPGSPVRWKRYPIKDDKWTSQDVDLCYMSCQPCNVGIEGGCDDCCLDCSRRVKGTEYYSYADCCKGCKGAGLAGLVEE